MNADGTQLRTVADLPGYAWEGSAQWSRDGKWIAFDATMDGRFENDHIFVVSADGGEPRDLGLGSQPSFSADDKQICFFTLGGNPTGEKAGICVMNADGNGRQYVTGGTYARWSPDGGRIAYLTKHNGGTIRVWDLVEGKSTIILKDKFGSMVSPLEWSPDSKQVCFLAQRQRNGPTELCVVDAGSEAAASKTLKEDVGPVGLSWSSTNKILFAIGQGAPQPHWLDFGQPETATPIPCSVDFGGAAWSPDGKRIAFDSAH